MGSEGGGGGGRGWGQEREISCRGRGSSRTLEKLGLPLTTEKATWIRFFGFRNRHICVVREASSCQTVRNSISCGIHFGYI